MTAWPCFQSWSLPACHGMPVASHCGRHGLSQSCYHAFLIMTHTKNMSHLNPSSLKSLPSVVQEEKRRTMVLVNKSFISFRCPLATPRGWNGYLPSSWKQTMIDSSNSKAIPTSVRWQSDSVLTNETQGKIVPGESRKCVCVHICVYTCVFVCILFFCFESRSQNMPGMALNFLLQDNLELNLLVLILFVCMFVCLFLSQSLKMQPWLA